MSVEVLQDGIEPPAQNNLTWIFKVRLNGNEPIAWQVDSFDLSTWCKEATGRYPRHERGDEDELADLRENWPRVEPRLRREGERQAKLGVKIGIIGMRSGSSEWIRAQQIPDSELPPLSSPQREAAKKLGVEEARYARSIVAQELTAASLLQKGKRLADVLQRKTAELGTGAVVESVLLNTLEERFDIEVRLGDEIVPMRIKEALVDDLFEGGSERADRSLMRILEVALGSRA
jgi:hypothetical protein